MGAGVRRVDRRSSSASTYVRLGCMVLSLVRVPIVTGCWIICLCLGSGFLF